ncbi:MAG TPA: MMPL family transporter [Methanocella sp.]|nr:MMPL family transporter [Methanocella sp.]
MVSIFKTLGEAITKRPWAIIAVWLIILLISLPLAGVFSANLQYDTQKFIPKDLGAFVAKDRYDEQFPGNNSTNQILVVVEADDNTTSMRFIDDLDARVKNATAIRNLTGTSSIYSIQRDAVVNMTPDLYNNLYEAFDNASDGNRELHNATDAIGNSSNGLYWLWDNVTGMNSEFYKARKQIVDSSAQLYSARDQIVMAHDGLYQIKGAIDVLIGIPAYFAQAYAGTSGSLDDANRTSLAIGATQAFIQGNVPSSNQQLAFGYLQAFDGAWNASSAISDPGARAQTAIKAAGPSFISGAIPASQQALMLNIVNNFPLSAYPGGERDFCVNAAAAAQNITAASQKQQLYALYDLGPSPSSAAIDNMVVDMAASRGGVDRSSIEEIYDLGRNPSDGTIGNYLINKAVSSLRDSDEGRNMSASDLQNATDVIHDAWNLGGTATKQDFDSYVVKKAKKGLNATEQRSVDEIWGWGRNPDESVVRSYVLREAGKDLNASENQTLAELYDLGRNASDESVKNFVVSKALDELNLSTNGTYFLALLGLERNRTDQQLKDFARSWEAAHSYDDPKILPDSVVKNLAAGNVTLYIVSTGDAEVSQASIDSVGALRKQVAAVQGDGQYAGVHAYVTGATAMDVDSESSSMNDLDNIDKVTIALVLIILGLYFRSFLTPFVPLVIIGVAVVVSLGFMGLVSTQIDIYYLVMTFMIVIMLGAGTDYCVFMLSRYAEERSKGAEVKASVKTAVEHAGKSIASSGFTAMIGFGSLTLVDQGIFRSIGIGTASSILFSMLVALTLVPSVLTIVGDRLFWPRKVYMSGPGATGRIWRGITVRVLKHARLIIVLALLITVPAVYVFTQLQLGNDFVSMMPGDVESKVGYDILNGEFGSGAMDKAMVVATMPAGLEDGSGNYTPGMLDQVESLSALLAATPGVDKVYSITRPEGATINYNNLSAYKGFEKESYQAYMDNNTGLDGRTTLLYVAFNGSPYSENSHRAIDSILEKMKAYERDNDGTTLLLGGGNVGAYEYQKLCTDKYALVIPVVLLGIFIILVLLLRSIFTPARLVFTLLMSISWTLAAFILVFQFWMQASVSWILPIILFCVLMGLGVDYDIFLVSRIREEVLKGRSDEEAISQAVESTGTIITLCGAVMASAFGSMLLSSMMELKEFGFVLCLAIILDATLMRLVIVPAIMVLMKKYNWWMPFSREPALVTAPMIEKPK